MPQSAAFSGDGGRLSVPQLVKSPKLIQKIILDWADQQFFIDQILRNAGTTDSGTFVYYEGTPLYVTGTTPIVNQGAEIPVATGQVGTPTPGMVVKRALGIEITQEDQDRNNYDKVNTQLTQLKNTFNRDWNQVFLAAALAKFPTFASSSLGTTGGWAAGDNITYGKQFIRQDLMNATKVIQLADADSSNGTGTQKFGFTPDTLVLNTNEATSMGLSREISAIFEGAIAGDDQLLQDNPIQKLKTKFMGLTIWVSWQMPAGQAILCQSKICGGIIDEVPLTTTPMYPLPTRQVWRSDTSRRSGVFIDQIKAGVVLTNLAGV